MLIPRYKVRICTCKSTRTDTFAFLCVCAYRILLGLETFGLSGCFIPGGSLGGALEQCDVRRNHEKTYFCSSTVAFQHRAPPLSMTSQCAPICWLLALYEDKPKQTETSKLMP